MHRTSDVGVDTFFDATVDITHPKYADEAIKRCSAIFKRFDVNGDGVISYDELASLFQAVDPDHWNADSVRRLMKAIDTGKDGFIRYEELLEWIMGSDTRWDEARQSVLLKGKHCFSPGDVVFVNRQVHSKKDTVDVEIDLSSGGKAGVILDSPDSKSLLIKQIKPGGLLAQWNEENTNHLISVGDRIIEISATIYSDRFEKKSSGKTHVEEYNAKEDPHEMVVLLKKKAVVKLTVQPCETAYAFAVKLADNYDTLSTLHEGHRSIVKRVKHRKTDQCYAVKSLLKQKMSTTLFLTEHESMRELDHPNVVNLHEVYEDFQAIHLVLQLCEGGEVLEAVLENDKFNERQAARVMQQVLAAVRFLHSHSICHRDVKAENVLLETECAIDRANVKLIDFGVARKFLKEPQKFHTMVGSSEYMSYEMLAMEGYTHLCDLWSCGIIMYLLLSGYPPFMGETDGETRRLIRTREVDFRENDWRFVSDEGKELIKKLLSVERTRPSADEAFRHEWIKDMAPKASDRKLEGTYQNLKGFSGHGKVKKLAHYALARRLTMEDLTDMRNEFEIIDRNKDGTVTFHEFKAMLDKRDEKSAEEMRRVFEAVDLDGNKRIEYTEFLAAALDKRQSAEEHSCWMAFNVFDHDGSGMISKKELKDILENEEKCLEMTSTFGTTIDSQSIARCLAECDADEDGQIDFQEFLDVMRGGQPYVPESPQPRRVNINRFT